MRSGVTALLAFLLTVSVPSAQAEFDWSAKYAGDFISSQSGARLLALGGVGVALADGPVAIIANPAMIFSDDGHALSLMHSDRFAGMVKVDHAAFTFRGADGSGLGIGLVRRGVDDISITRLRDPSNQISSDNRVIVADNASASEYAFQFAYALEKPYGRIGVAAKLLYKRLYHNNGFGLGFDVGYARRLGGLTLGAQLRDLLPTVLVWDTGHKEGISPAARAGASYTIDAKRLNAVIIPVVEFEYRFESAGDPDASAWHAGLEYCINRLASARIGFDDGHLTYGAGLSIGALVIDYAFVGHDDLGSTHRVSLGYGWGGLP